jgi:HAE1 family hydrophobic/amphiphilic exporter-1
MRFRFFTLILTFVILGVSIWLFLIAPKGFFPEEDTSFISVSTEAAQDISYDAMLEKQKAAAEIIGSDPAVMNVFYAVGGGRGTLNSGRMFIGLKSKKERPPMTDVVQGLRKKLDAIEGLKVYMRPVQNIQIGGQQAKSQYIYTLQAGNLDQLYEWSDKMRDALSSETGFQDVNSDLQLKSLQAIVTVDQQKAASVGVTYEDIRQALYSAYGTGQVASLYTDSNDYDVIFEVAPEYQKSVDDIGQIYVTGTAPGGRTVAMNSIAAVSRGQAALSVNHQGQIPSVSLSFNLAPGIPLSDAVKRIATVRERLKVPDSVTGNFQGTAQAFQDSAEGQGLLLLLSIVVIYIILGMLYESFVHPITILSGLPSAGLGAILTLMLFKMDVSVISIIGIVLLIGIVKKNAIMMVDFAIGARHEGKSAEEAIFEACMLRFRPIMMTTMAAIFGTLPIALSIGDGAELRQPLGIAVVGGLLTSQLLTLYITPVIYVYLENLSGRFKRGRTAPAG